MLAAVSKLFELGFKVDWEMFYKGFETEPIPYPRYQFDDVKSDIFASNLQLISPTGNHPAQAIKALYDSDKTYHICFLL